MPCVGAGHLEVHVAEVVFGAQDVGEDRVLLAFLDEPHRHAGHGGAHRDAGVEQGERPAADRRHGRRPVRLQDVGDDADGVGELLERRQHGLQRALGEVAVSDLAAERAAHRPHFTRGERREVVVQHERLGGLLRLVDAVEALDVVGGAERDAHQRLRLAAREQRRAVRARAGRPCRSVICRTSVGLASVDAQLGVEHLRAKALVLDVAEHGFHVAAVVRELGLERFRDLVLHALHGLHAGLLVLLVDRLGDLRLGQLADAGLEAFRALGLLPRHLGRTVDLGEQLFLRGDQFLDAAVRDFERRDDVIFGHLQRAALDHHDRVVGAGDHQVHVAVFELLERGVQHPVVLHSRPRARQRSVP